MASDFRILGGPMQATPERVAALAAGGAGIFALTALTLLGGAVRAAWLPAWAVAAFARTAAPAIAWTARRRAVAR